MSSRFVGVFSSVITSSVKLYKNKKYTAGHVIRQLLQCLLFPHRSEFTSGGSLGTTSLGVKRSLSGSHPIINAPAH